MITVLGHSYPNRLMGDRPTRSGPNPHEADDAGGDPGAEGDLKKAAYGDLLAGPGPGPGRVDQAGVGSVTSAARSMTWSMKPYSWRPSAVNQRSRSESASIRSTGWPVWKAIRSAIIRFR